MPAPPPDPTPEALRLHAHACAKGQTGYLDPITGAFCLSSHYLRAQGRCCGLGCRHCPWPPDVQKKANRPADRKAWPG